MKKYKTIAYILVIIFFVLAIAFVSYQVMSANPKKETQMKQKAKTEIKYLESKMLTLFNGMNNIQFENYKISISEVTPNSSGDSSEKSTESNSKSGEGGMGEETSSNSEDSKSSNPSGSESSKGSSSSSSEGSETSGEESSSGSTSENENSNKSTETFGLEPTGVLLSNEQIDWDKIKKEVENMYISIPTITLDLYKTDIEDKDVLNFNTEFDALTKAVESQKKEDVLPQLVKVYENVVRFREKTGDEEEKIVSRTKLNIYRAYSKLDSENWEEMSKDIQSGIEEFTKLLTGTEIENEKQYSINKAYVMLSELQKAPEQKSSEIFLIKYKNTLEELSNI